VGVDRGAIVSVTNKTDVLVAIGVAVGGTASVISAICVAILLDISSVGVEVGVGGLIIARGILHRQQNTNNPMTPITSFPTILDFQKF
jgi:hypothetical protein